VTRSREAWFLFSYENGSVIFDKCKITFAQSTEIQTIGKHAICHLK